MFRNGKKHTLYRIREIIAIEPYWFSSGWNMISNIKNVIYDAKQRLLWYTNTNTTTAMTQSLFLVSFCS